MTPVIGMYRPLRTPMHRAPAWFKVALLAAVAILVLFVQDPVTSLGLAAASLLLLISTAPPWRPALAAVAWTLLFAVMAAGYQFWRGEWALGVDVAADLATVVFLALAVSASTSMERMLDLASAALRPLRRFVPHETIGLMFALLIRLIPEMVRLLGESRQAAMARGVERSPRAILVPTATRTVGFALDLGAALHARGISDAAAAEADSPLDADAPRADEVPTSRRARREAARARRGRTR